MGRVNSRILTTFLYSGFCQWHVISVHPENCRFDPEWEIRDCQGINNTTKWFHIYIYFYLFFFHTSIIPSIISIIIYAEKEAYDTVFCVFSIMMKINVERLNLRYKYFTSILYISIMIINKYNYPMSIIVNIYRSLNRNNSTFTDRNKRVQLLHQWLNNSD